MAKKNIKKEEFITVETNELKTDISNIQLTEEELKVGAHSRHINKEDIKGVEFNPEFTNIGFAEPKKTLSNISMEELIAYKNGCELVCKQYENISRLDNINHKVFNEFQIYAKMIFNEIEKRIIEICTDKQ